MGIERVVGLLKGGVECLCDSRLYLVVGLPILSTHQCSYSCSCFPD